MRDRLGAAVVLVALGVLGALLSGPVTDASWTGRAAIPGSPVSTGDLDLRIDGQDTLDLPGLGGSDLLPGAVRSVIVTVSNHGSTSLSYDLSSSATDPDGRHLGAALQRTVRAVVSGTCGAALLADPRTLGPGESEQLCLRVVLPADATSAVAGSSTRVAFDVAATGGSWSDRVPVQGGPLATIALTPPEVSCTLTAINWNAVPGATSYRLINATTGVLVDTVSSSTLTRLLGGILGGLAVEAVYGSPDWVSAPSTCP